jgi:hypothetical protein
VDPAAAARNAQAGLIAQQMVSDASAKLASAIDRPSPPTVGIVRQQRVRRHGQGPGRSPRTIRAAKGADMRQQMAAAYEKAVLACDPKTPTSTSAMAAAGLAMKTAFEGKLKQKDLQDRARRAGPGKARTLVGEAAR